MGEANVQYGVLLARPIFLPRASSNKRNSKAISTRWEKRIFEEEEFDENY
jgi:hypothetical protein